VRQQTIAIKSPPLTRVFVAVLDQPLLFPSALGIRRTRLTIVFSSRRLSGLARSCLAHEVIREAYLLFVG
jgi:hypothetical protein